LRPPGDKGGTCKPACAFALLVPDRLPPGETGGRRYDDEEAGGGENFGDTGKGPPVALGDAGGGW